MSRQGYRHDYMSSPRNEKDILKNCVGFPIQPPEFQKQQKQFFHTLIYPLRVYEGSPIAAVPLRL